MDAVSGLFLNALGTDMTAMEEYFPFISKAFEVMQYMAWAILFLVMVWQLFRTFGGPITEAENPWQLVARSALFALLVGYAKPIFTILLDIARAPYTALMELAMTGEDFTFAGLEQVLTSGLTTIVSTVTVIIPILLLILLISVGWNYFKLLLETVERYIVVGILYYTSPLAFAMGGSKATSQIFKSWCRMVGSQLLLLVMNVWFLRAFSSSVLEVEPINFTLRSDEEQFNIISSYASWLKISPMRLQFKSMTRKADSDKHIAMVQEELAQEENPQCKEIGDDYTQGHQTEPAYSCVWSIWYYEIASGDPSSAVHGYQAW